jgi:hypothetical protein
MDSFASRLAAIPHEVLKLARGGCSRNADMEEVLDHAEMMMRRKNGQPEPVNEDVALFQPFLTRRQTRVILESLRGHWAEGADQECLQNLVEWFDGMVAQ